MIVDYETFGDVISFDTTFGTNQATRPLAVFSGFNNHREIVIFGVALLYDETGLSFAWAFQSFLRCHKEKLPILIYTDQDKAMEYAISIVMPEVRHALCTWHLFENAGKMRNKLGEKIIPFIDDFRSCVKEYTNVDEFEQHWQLLLNTYDVAQDSWVTEIYKKKKKWSFAYLKDVFLAGARTTQLSESVNSMLKRDLGSCLTMKKFFRGVDKFLKNVRDNELESDFKARQTSPYLAITHSPILRHAARVYTPKLFLRFQRQFDAEHGVRLNNNAFISEPHERTAYQNGLAYKIKYDPSSETISCGCCMFETHGYLCAHILRVFNICDINQIPEKYIMKRWTKEAKSGLAIVSFTAPDLDAQVIRNALCSEFNRLVYRVGSSKYFANELRRLIYEGNKFIDVGDVVETNNGTEIASAQCGSASDHILLGATGLKTKDRKKPGRKRRIRSCLEKNNGYGKKKKKNEAKVQENGYNDEHISLTL